MYTKHQWESPNHYNFKYVQYLPKDYDPTKNYPLVFFLHGAGERGDDLDLAVNNSFMWPTFQGEPERVAIPNCIDAMTDALWTSLDEENKISLYVRYTDLETGAVEERMINKNK